jgi:hypothetical protein
MRRISSLFVDQCLVGAVATAIDIDIDNTLAPATQ